MKNLESLNSEKFKMNACEIKSIKGGKMDDSLDKSYEYSYTDVGDNSVMDARLYDICADW
ncbi:hypothetical protein C900_00437 [Fulvivirga imtechensis AK7]|uniref:Uncharacterized protein n=1 Tax=Fulvivirga imtechensis AK7 TaxID=1237149 RepID=L8JHV9_9BACT|nr:hypothetical protein [Fulvivirga imtechensis]ELR68405.1 hypothetical protein C900_00437 [Fulvivirga imtechensis AK7]